MLVYLIGPSGAGKSTIAAGVVLQRPDIRHVDLDTVIRKKDCQLFFHNGNRWKEFWSCVGTCLKELDPAFTGISLIDCGAGCLQTYTALSFFKSKPSVIAFVGSASFLFKRAKESKPHWENKTLQEYEECELSAFRRKFYDAAKFKLDVSELSGQQAVSELVAILQKMGKTTVAT